MKIRAEILISTRRTINGGWLFCNGASKNSKKFFSLSPCRKSPLNIAIMANKEEEPKAETGLGLLIVEGPFEDQVFALAVSLRVKLTSFCALGRRTCFISRKGTEIKRQSIQSFRGKVNRAVQEGRQRGDHTYLSSRKRITRQRQRKGYHTTTYFFFLL